MIKRLEQVAALVVAAGLAIVSYWLFFSWAQGGGAGHRRLPVRQQERSGLIGPLLGESISAGMAAAAGQPGQAEALRSIPAAAAGLPLA